MVPVARVKSPESTRSAANIISPCPKLIGFMRSATTISRDGFTLALFGVIRVGALASFPPTQTAFSSAADRDGSADFVASRKWSVQKGLDPQAADASAPEVVS